VNANGVIVVPDTTPPALVIGSPAAGGIVSGRNVTISATATDSSSGIQAVEFYVDGTLLARDTSTPYTANWNLRKASKTTHTIKVRAIDNAGNAAEQSIIVTVQ
jgi:chitinase